MKKRTKKAGHATIKIWYCGCIEMQTNKGIFYSVAAMMLLGLVVILGTSQSSFMARVQESATSKIVADQLTKFEATAERDFLKALDVSSRRALVTAVNRILVNGSAGALDNATRGLEEMVINGTLNNTPQSLMADNTIPDWIVNMQAEGTGTGYAFSAQILSFSVAPADSFSILFNATLRFSVTDRSGRVSVNRTVNRGLNVSVEGFSDPTMTMNTGGLVYRTIAKSPYQNYTYGLANGTRASGSFSGVSVVANSSNSTYIGSIADKESKILVTDNAANVSSSGLWGGIISEQDANLTVHYIVVAPGAMAKVPDGTTIYMDEQTKSAWDLNGLEDAISRKLYMASVEGPSFLDRLEGRLSNTRAPFGLETFVDLAELSVFGITVKGGQSVVDRLYFQNATHTGYPVRGISEGWFRLDKELDGGVAHSRTYGVGDLIPA